MLLLIFYPPKPSCTPSLDRQGKGGEYLYLWIIWQTENPVISALNFGIELLYLQSLTKNK